MNVCEKCKYMCRGRAIRSAGERPGAIRSGLQGGDYICGKHPIIPGKVDPQTGFQPLPSGADCRDLNPDGECSDFVRAVSPVHFVVVVSIAIALFAGFVAAQ